MSLMMLGFSAQIVGILVVPAGAAAVLLGGWIVKKLKLTRDRILIYCVVIQLLNIPLVFMFLLFCPTQNYVGLNYHPEQEHHQEQISEGGFAQVCNANCFCNHETADPVCGSDGLMYLSPCLAGCQNFGEKSLISFYLFFYEIDGTLMMFFMFKEVIILLGAPASQIPFLQQQEKHAMMAATI